MQKAVVEVGSEEKSGTKKARNRSGDRWWAREKGMKNPVGGGLRSLVPSRYQLLFSNDRKRATANVQIAGLWKFMQT